MARYVPGNVPEPMATEFNKIATALDTADVMLALDPVFAVPKKFREGSIVLAKAPWNPGSGDGIYCFRAGSWRFLG